MQKLDTNQNLLFLLSLAPVSFGCVITSDDDDTDGNNSTDGGQTTMMTDDDDDDDDTTAGDDDDDDDDTTAGDDDDDDDTTAGTGDTTAGVEDPCVGYGDIVTECYSEKEGITAYEYCVEYVADMIAPVGKECVAAYEDYLACLTALSCEEFMMKDVCLKEIAVVDEACFGEDTEGGSSSGTGGG